MVNHSPITFSPNLSYACTILNPVFDQLADGDNQYGKTQQDNADKSLGNILRGFLEQTQQITLASQIPWSMIFTSCGT